MNTHRHPGFICKGEPPSASTPFLPAPKKWGGVLPDKYVALLVEQVSTSSLMASVNALAAIPTRHTDSPHIASARNWIVSQFSGLGYADVTTPAWASGSHSGQNIVCTKPGSGNDVIIVCAHYDDRMESSSSTAVAPGADDNASGIAALLEIARHLRGIDLNATIRFVAFSGEEQGLLGSTAYAAAVKAAGTQVRLVLNMDMIGYPPLDGSVTIERDIGNVHATNDAASQGYATAMAQAGADYTDLPIRMGPIYSSDYMPFEAQGYPTIGAFEGEGNPNYHHTSDAPATLDPAYLTKVTQMVLATLLNETLDAVDEAAGAVDLYIRDSQADTGSQPSPVPHWTSPDIWVRNAAPADGDNPDLGHQPPINGVVNYLYARVHNRGTSDLAANQATVRTYRCDPGTGMIWPNDFQSLGQLTVTDPIPAGGSVRVGPFGWTPQIVGHECLLAIGSTGADHSVVDLYPDPVRHDLLVRFDNNVGQRNVEPQLAVPKGLSKFRFAMRGGLTSTVNDWHLDATALPAGSVVKVTLPRRLASAATINGFAKASTWRRTTLSLHGRNHGELRAFPLDAGERIDIQVEVTLASEIQHLASYPLVVTQMQDGLIAGRMTLELIGVSEFDGIVFGNPRSMELHMSTCRLWDQIAPGGKAPFLGVEDAVRRGYNGCRYCLPGLDTDAK